MYMRKSMRILLLALFLCCMPTAVMASEQRGSIRLDLDAGELAVINGAVTLYQVGSKVEDGYRITEGFGGGIVRQEDASSVYFAQWLAESAGESGITMLLDADGDAIFSDLEEGLYMLVQTERMDGFYPILPVLISVPEDDQWNRDIYRQPVPVVTEIPKTGQSPIPFFGVLGMMLSSAGLLLCCGKRKK